MKAIVMAGGQGTRLKAVTGELPKPLVPLLGRPLMEHILLLLRQHGFTRVCAALGYGAEAIMDCFGDGSGLGIRLEYKTENQALGTAGAVRNCGDFIAGEDVLVISGDAACDLDLSLLWRRHRESGALATLALYRNPSPLRYGLAVTDEADQIRAFIEKPDWSRVVTDLVNTGIYVLSPRALAAIPEGPCDFGKDLFPQLLRQGETLLGLPMKGYWADVGTPLSYYQTCVDALEGRLKLQPGGAFRTDVPVSPVSPAESIENALPAEGFSLDCPCRERAAAMGALSALMLEMDADYSDGIRLMGKGFRLRLSPRENKNAIRISVAARDGEFARRLAFSARDLIRALDL